jgi:hypothetical protein
MKTKNVFLALLSISIFLWSACENDAHIPPTVTFKTGGNYTSNDATVAKSASITVGIIADKKEDDMKTYNISYAYDGATSTTTKETFTLSSSENVHYEKDYTFTVRAQAGVEEWFFVITDKDGNIAKLKIKLTVN